MTSTFLVMAAGVFFGGALSAAVGSTLLVRWARASAVRLAPRWQAAFWMLLAALPLAVGATALLAALLPSLGFAHDHCLTHESHHPHLCLHHPQPLSYPAVVLALAGIVRVSLVLVRELRSFRLAARTVAALRPDGAERESLQVVRGRVPAAFVVGLLHPRVYLSEALLLLPDSVRRAVVAHEQCHVRHRHLLARLLCRLLGSLHLPAVAREVHDNLAAAQELQADAEAAHATGDPVMVAESLLRMARAQAGAPRGALAFADGALRSRIVALLESAPARSPWSAALVAVLAGLALFAALAFPASVHHAFETTLGWLH